MKASSWHLIAIFLSLFIVAAIWATYEWVSVWVFWGVFMFFLGTTFLMGEE